MANAKNLSAGTLYESISASTATLLVYVGDGSASTIKAVWPTAPFYATIMPANPVAGVANSMDSEIVLVNSVSNDQIGNTALSVTRAQRGTTAKAFDASAVVLNGIYADDTVFLGENGTTETEQPWITNDMLDKSTFTFGNYSTTEKDTGFTWIDGKHIYQKTIDFGALPNNSQKSVSTGVSGIHRVLQCYGYAASSTANLVLPYIAGNGNIAGDVAVGYVASSNQVRITTGNDRSSLTECYVTIVYTKTS